jgi:hypothetical protein
MSDPYQTATMAELLAKQGMPAQAAGIYRRLTRATPLNVKNQMRLATLSARLPHAPAELRARLAELAGKVPETRLAALIDDEGLFLVQFPDQSDVDASDVLALCATVTAEEVVARWRGAVCIARRAADAVWLCLWVSEPCIEGRARFWMRVLATDLRRELR